MRYTFLTSSMRISLGLAILAISYLAFSDQSSNSVVSFSDKLNHVVAFFTLAFLLDYALPKKIFNRQKMLLLVAYATAIEIIQFFISYRDCSLLDILVDAIGISAYWLLSPKIISLPLLRDRTIEPDHN